MSSITFLLSKIKILKISLTDIEEIQSLNNLNYKNALSLFHINTYSLSKTIEQLEYLLDKTKTDFNVIGISESGIKKDKSPINSKNLKGYSHESCPTESAAGGTLLYTSNNLSYKPRNDLCVYRPTDLESTFIEILSPKKTNVIVGLCDCDCGIVPLSPSTYGLE